MTGRADGGMVRLSPPGVSELMFLINHDVGHVNKVVAICWRSCPGIPPGPPGTLRRRPAVAHLGDSYTSGNGGQSNLAELGERLGTGGGHKADSSKIPRTHTASLSGKNLMGMPWRVAFALQDDGCTATWITDSDRGP